MKIAVGSDHAGFHLKQHVKGMLVGQGHEIVDVGTDTPESVDYPRFAEEAARLVAAGEVERAVIACGSGVGVSIVANKVIGVRAVNAHDAQEAEMSRRHNDANVLCLSADLLGEDQMAQMIRIFLDTPFDGGRHARRVEKIAKIESEQYGK